jgi:GNAT superfamily N-acetyltransferase
VSAILRRSAAADVADLHRIRLSVRENRLTDPSRLGEADYIPFIDGHGETWHAMVEGQIAGFAALDHHDKSVWALFVDPAFEGSGLGKLLLTKLVDQARAAAIPTLSLVTTPGTRAETFYLRNGWQADGLTESGECRLILNLHG